jgi:hypothetical protein
MAERERLVSAGAGDETKVVKMREQLPYRDATFEAGKFYRVKDEPQGFIERHIVRNGAGSVITNEEDIGDAEIQEDPRPAAKEQADKDRAEKLQEAADKRAAIEQERAQRVVPSTDGRARVFTSTEDVFGQQRLAAASTDTVKEGSIPAGSGRLPVDPASDKAQEAADKAPPARSEERAKQLEDVNREREIRTGAAETAPVDNPSPTAPAPASDVQGGTAPSGTSAGPSKTGSGTPKK